MARWLTIEGKNLDSFGQFPYVHYGVVFFVFLTFECLERGACKRCACVFACRPLKRRPSSILYTWWARLHCVREGVSRAPGSTPPERGRLIYTCLYGGPLQWNMLRHFPYRDLSAQIMAPPDTSLSPHAPPRGRGWHHRTCGMPPS
jgi:hypothetical protein